jgi:peptidoglycan/xylan/chitin deacetylase (PgdA/CDA1 family)
MFRRGLGRASLEPNPAQAPDFADNSAEWSTKSVHTDASSLCGMVGRVRGWTDLAPTPRIPYAVTAPRSLTTTAPDGIPLAAVRRVACFFHDIEQNIDSTADVDACRAMVEAFLRIEARQGVRATYNVVGRLFVEQPDLVERIVAAGHEVAFHSYHHQSDWRPEYYADEVRHCREVASWPRGYRSPRSDWDRRTLASCWDAGMAWNAEADRADWPYFIYRNLVRIPIAGDDWPLQMGKMNGREWVQHFERLVQRRRFIAFGSHDCIASGAPRERLAAWEALLHTARAQGAACLTFSDAASVARRGILQRVWQRMRSEFAC